MRRAVRDVLVGLASRLVSCGEVQLVRILEQRPAHAPQRDHHANAQALRSCVSVVERRDRPPRRASSTARSYQTFRWLEEQMSTRERSLSVLVAKWLGQDLMGSARVTRFSQSRQKPWRSVCVETTQPAGPIAIVFFRHDDGSWCVYPPDAKRPTMGFARNPLPATGDLLASAA
jgi:hypothetical protein